MKAPKLIVWILVVIFIIASAYTVAFGVPIGVKDFAPRRALDLGAEWGGSFSVLYDTTDATPEEIAESVQKMQQRLDLQGVLGAIVTAEGEDHIRVEMPINDTTNYYYTPQDLALFVGEIGDLQIFDDDNKLLVNSEHVLSAETRANNSAYVLSLQLDEEGTKILADATREMAKYDGTLIIKKDGIKISSMTLASAIEDGRCAIQGFTIEECLKMTAQLKSGPLPTKNSIIYQIPIGAAMGENAADSVALAAGVLLLGIALWLCIEYRMAGFSVFMGILGALAAMIFLMALLGMMMNTGSFAVLAIMLCFMLGYGVITLDRAKRGIALGKTPFSALKSALGQYVKQGLMAGIMLFLAGLIILIVGTDSLALNAFAIALVVGMVLAMFFAFVVANGLIYLLLGFAPNGTKMYFPKKKEKKDGEQA